jgi:hypothetical protein
VRRLRLAAWLGLAAIAIQSYLPVHFAYDLSEALQAAHALAHVGDTSHPHPSNHAPGHSHGHSDCSICLSAAGVLASMPAGSVYLPVPIALPIARAMVSIRVLAAGVRTASYTPRAPPVAV